jgi:hypothetical protein
MSKWRKVFQGLMILAILFGMLGAIACLAPGSGLGVSHPASVVIMGDSGNLSYTGLTANTGEVCRTSVAWNHPTKKGRDVRRSVAWN